MCFGTPRFGFRTQGFDFRTHGLDVRIVAFVCRTQQFYSGQPRFVFDTPGGVCRTIACVSRIFRRCDDCLLACVARTLSVHSGYFRVDSDTCVFCSVPDTHGVCIGCGWNLVCGRVGGCTARHSGTDDSTGVGSATHAAIGVLTLIVYSKNHRPLVFKTLLFSWAKRFFTGCWQTHHGLHSFDSGDYILDLPFCQRYCSGSPGLM
jgi:hypothetical protein